MDTPLKQTGIWSLSLPELLAGAAGLAAVVASLAGFIPGLYRDRAGVVAQTHGYDVGNIIVAAVLGLGLFWSVRGSARGRLVVIGALGCLVYSYITYAFLIVLNPATVLYIAVLSLAFWSVAAGLLRFDRGGVDDPSRQPPLRQLTGVFLLLVAVLFAVNWFRQIGAAVIGGQLPADLVANAWPMNPVWVEDLGFVLPLMGLGGLLLLRRRRIGVTIALGVMAFMPLLSVTILSMSVSMAIAGQTLDMALIGIFALLGIVSTALLVTWFRGQPQTTRDQSPVISHPLRPHHTT